MSFVDLGEVQLFFTDEGVGGPPMLFVHGYTCDSHDWNWQLPHFESRHRVIAVDLRGHGRSSVPADGYEPARFAADLAGLLEHLACEPVVAVGHSLGGLIVTALAVTHPTFVRAVIAVDPAYLVAEEVMRDVAPLRDALSDGDPVPLVQTILDGADAATTPAFLRGWHRRRVAGIAPHVLRETLLSMATDPRSPASGTAGEQFLGRRGCPVLSFFTDPKRSAADAALFRDPRSRSVTWDAVGHWLHQERPDAFNECVDAWLASL